MNNKLLNAICGGAMFCALLVVLSASSPAQSNYDPAMDLEWPRRGVASAGLGMMPSLEDLNTWSRLQGGNADKLLVAEPRPTPMARPASF